METSSYITSAEVPVTDAFIDDHLNQAGSQMHQQLANTKDNWFTVPTQITVDQNTNSTNLPNDFYTIRTVDKITGNSTDGYIPVHSYDPIQDRQNLRGVYGYPRISIPAPRYNLGAISQSAPGGIIEFLPASIAPGTYLITYVPQYVPLTLDADVVTFPMQWHDFMITYAAIACLNKVYEPSDDLKEELVKLERMIIKGSANKGQPLEMISTRRKRW